MLADLGGHGIGRFIHEWPAVPNTADGAGAGVLLTPGLVLAVEPFLAAGATGTVTDADGWTLRTADGGLAAQFEHTVVVGARGPIVLTA